MSTQEMVAAEGSWKTGFKQQILAVWLKVKKLAKDIERSMDHYDETYLRGL